MTFLTALYKNLFVILLMTLVLALSSVVHASGPLNTSDDGVASVWDNSAAITYHPESGTCGPYSNASMLTMIQDVLALWTGLDEVDLSFEQASGTVGQVGVDNYDTYLYLGQADTTAVTDEINPVLFDDDAEITAEVAGEENQYLVLGFAGADGFNADYSEISDGQALFNCRCLTGHASGPCYSDDGQSTIEVTEADLEFTILHEMGHFLNLEHSQVNIDLFDDADADNDIDIPIMFPIAFSDEVEMTPRIEDIAMLAALYPSAALSESWCKVTGTLLDADGNELMCADVWALDGDASNTVAATSGNWAIGTDANDDGDIVDSGECTSNCGYFEMWVQAQAAYTVTVEPVEATFTGGSSVGPCVNGQLTSVTEEEVATISSAQCTAGTTVALGSVTTVSTGGVGSDSGSGGGGSSSGDDFDALNPVGYCSLVNFGEDPGFPQLFFAPMLVCLVFMRLFFNRL